MSGTKAVGEALAALVRACPESAAREADVREILDGLRDEAYQEGRSDGYADAW